METVSATQPHSSRLSGWDATGEYVDATRADDGDKKRGAAEEGDACDKARWRGIKGLDGSLDGER